MKRSGYGGNRILFSGIALVIMVAWFMPIPAEAQVDSFDPVIRNIEGWTVHVDPSLLEGGDNEENGKQALSMLANNLERIRLLIPEKILGDMQTLEIWIEHEHPTLGAMQYHPSLQWLVANKHDPRLAKKVHITRASDLYSRQQLLKHPLVVLHELAHAYHDQILSFDNPEIIEVFESSRDKGLYREVLLYTGKKVRHYGLTNHKEFFAEATEAWFYRNDFYPFVRAELEEYDPELYQLMKTIWGE